MAVAVYRAWRSNPERSAGLVALHGGQLALNASWPWAFFSLRSPGRPPWRWSPLWMLRWPPR
ncbi:MAG: tryptophan-rich sensory protein [Acidimicrobiales bacterium]